MMDFCKVCGIKLSANNTVNYRPGSCRDCELERKKLYSGLSMNIGSKSKSKKGKKKQKVKAFKAKKSKKGKKGKASKSKLKKQRLLKAKKLAKYKKLTKLRILREKKRKKLRAQVEKLRKIRVKKLLKLKQLKKKQKIRERKEKERLKKRLRKAKEIERRLIKKERERLKKEKEKLRQLARQEKERIRAAKKAEKDRIRAEKQRVRLEKQREKERLKKAKEAAKFAIIQARESARKAAQEARRLREEAKKPPIVSVVTKVKELQPPPNVKVISAAPRQEKSPQPTKKLDPKKFTIADAALLESATVIPAKGLKSEDKEKGKQTSGKKGEGEAPKFKKDPDPIIDRYNPYSKQGSDPNAPRPPSPTPWLASNFSVVKGDFKETKEEESGTAQSGMSEQQVREIIEKVKSDHKKKT